MPSPALKKLALAIRTSMHAQSPVVGPTDYVAYWTMDNADISAPTIFDSTANSHDATMVNTPTTNQVGQVDQGVEFLNSNTEYATLVDHADFRSANFSVMCWIKLIGDTGQNQTILQSYDFGSSVHAGFKFHIFTDGDLKVGMLVANNTGQVEGVNYVDAFGTTVLPAPSLGWRHVAATYDGANVRLYLGGALESTTPWAGGVAYKGSNRVTIAAENTTQFGISWLPRAIIDELKYFDRVLSEAEILATVVENGGPLPVSITLTPSSITDNVANGPYTTATVASSVTGGVGPFTYSWVRISGSTITADTPLLADTAFSGNRTDANSLETFELTVTDTGDSNITHTKQIVVDITWGTP